MVLLSASLGLAVRTFWSHLEKHHKSALGQNLKGRVNILAWGPFRVKKWVLKKMVLGRNDFVVEFEGNPSCPNEV